MARRNWLVGLVLIASWLTSSLLITPELTHAAASNAPLAGGTFTVNTTSDGNVSDSILSFHEALLLARGGTGASGLNRTLSNSEKVQLSGCTFSGNSITGGCGATITDTIRFDLTGSTTIYLTTPTPNIDDSAGTIIDGAWGSVFPVIDASFLSPQNALYIYSNHNWLQFFTVRGAPITNILVTGSYNTFYDVTMTKAGTYGISLSGNYNTIDSSQIGISSTSEWDCVSVPSGNGSHGVFIPQGAHHHTIRNSDIGCNGGNGIEVQPSVTDGYHTFGPNNRIGTNASSGSLGNDLYGIDLGTGWNVIHSSTVVDNQGGGIRITANANNVYGTTVNGNNLKGMEISGTAANNKIGCTADCFFSGSIIGNILTSNFGPGLLITDTANNTSVFGNRIGVNGGGGAAWNTAEGILIYGSSNNRIGDGLSSVYLNRIGTHKYADNIRIDGGASSNTIANNLIYNSDFYGVRITGGSHDNTIGGSSASYGNQIHGNALDGVYISGNNNTVNANLIYSNDNGVHITGSSTGNVVGTNSNSANSIYSNLADGISIDGTAHSNTLGINHIGTNPSYQQLGNLGNGITIYGSAYTNVIGGSSAGNWIAFNQMNGIVISGASVRNNLLNSNHSEFNVQNGLLLTNGTYDNIIHKNGDSNFFGGNSLNGILISLGAHDNWIDVNHVDGNLHNGIELTDSGTINNVISGTLIYLNQMDGINERSSANQNSWSHLSTYQNGGLGIDKSAAIDGGNSVTAPFPQITSVTTSGGNVTVNGTASPSWFGGTQTTVELYTTYVDSTGVAEGKIYLGASTSGLGNGAWSVTFPGSAGCYVAFQTTYDPANGSSTSSEFGPNSCRLALPLIMR
ncbi:MAG: right-handed parallel beta-helix repeat-containing protein [Chloroflexi bacterium]|nr:right-handed parallel beta-helix repeat-containing protein [Chloroflexota bacterium]